MDEKTKLVILCQVGVREDLSGRKEIANENRQRVEIARVLY